MERYNIISYCGRGSFSFVDKVQRKIDNKIFAAKHLGNKDDCLTEFYLLKDLNHPNIIKLEDMIDESHLILEYMETTLSREIKKQGRIYDIRLYLFQILRGLVYLHSNYIIHRDLKPANILVTGNIIKICDFGAACKFNIIEDFDIGTICYRSPELLLKEKSGYFVDVWAAGLIFSEMCGVEIIDGSTNEEVLNSIKLSYGYTISFLDNGNDLLLSLLEYDYKIRITAKDALNHPYISLTSIHD